MTDREQQVVKLLSEGNTVGEIAAQLQVSRATAAALAKSVIEDHGDPTLSKVDAHIAALRHIDVKV